MHARRIPRDMCAGNTIPGETRTPMTAVVNWGCETSGCRLEAETIDYSIDMQKPMGPRAFGVVHGCLNHTEVLYYKNESVKYKLCSSTLSVRENIIKLLSKISEQYATHQLNNIIIMHVYVYRFDPELNVSVLLHKMFYLY